MPAPSMRDTRIVSELVVDDAAGIAGQAHLGAAGGLVKLGERVFVVADDEHHLALFDPSCVGGHFALCTTHSSTRF
jgi:hypothetical protein